MPRLLTTLGALSQDDLGMILPHEHIFVDRRQPDVPGFARAHTENVVALMAPELEKARAAGVTAIVVCTPIGVGRRADFVVATSQAADFPIVMPTGIYREPWVPEWARAAGEAKLRDWMLAELTGEIADTGVPAGWIKLSAGDDGITPVEAKILRAAARAAAQTHATIGSHTIRGCVVRDQLDILEEAGYTPLRFIWIHTQAEPDFALHLEMARRGCWIEYDGIGWDPAEDAVYLARILRVLDAGLGHRLMLSMDRGWYDPAKPGGGTPAPFTYLSEIFLPKLRAAGVDDVTIRLLTHENPFRAFAR
ncbi:MAG: esterase [Anaerolineae bacterium]|nr:esterase [Anaerolineae bacterium]